MNLERSLQTVGKMIFIEYYNSFKNEAIPNLDMVDTLPRIYTLNSRRSRTYHARWIFHQGLQIDALKIIASSDRVSVEVVEEARKLIKSEEASC